jgi:hypothetical protein
MRATVLYGAGDVRVEDVPDAGLAEPDDALVRVTRAAICGSDLWPHKSMEPTADGRRMGHEFIGIVEAAAPTSPRFWPATSLRRRSSGRTEPVPSARKACIRRACTAGATATKGSTVDREKPCAFLRRTGRSFAYRSSPTRRSCLHSSP